MRVLSLPTTLNRFRRARSYALGVFFGGAYLYLLSRYVGALGDATFEAAKEGGVGQARFAVVALLARPPRVFLRFVAGPRGRAAPSRRSASRASSGSTSTSCRCSEASSRTRPRRCSRRSDPRTTRDAVRLVISRPDPRARGGRVAAGQHLDIPRTGRRRDDVTQSSYGPGGVTRVDTFTRRRPPVRS